MHNLKMTQKKKNSTHFLNFFIIKKQQLIIIIFYEKIILSKFGTLFLSKFLSVYILSRNEIFNKESLHKLIIKISLILKLGIINSI